MQGKMIIISAPSGSGKTTIVKYIMSLVPNFGFSVSATSRPPREGEKDGTDYFFMSPEEFRNGIITNRFAEWEEVYPGHYYGTLNSEIERIWSEGRHIIFDVDVKGGLSLKKAFGDKALSLFIMPPDIDALGKRLRMRGKDSEEKIEMRVAKAEHELTFAGEFDRVIINDILEIAQAEALKTVTEFLNN
jgi:guanylate kinase